MALPVAGTRAKRVTARTEKQEGSLPVASSTYLGKASDIRFLDTVFDFMHAEEEEHNASRDEGNDDQYDHQSDVLEPVPAPIYDKPLKLSTKETGMGYLDIYFSTIHIAYPFLCRPMVLHHARRIWTSDLNEADDRTWLALLSESSCR